MNARRWIVVVAFGWVVACGGGDDGPPDAGSTCGNMTCEASESCATCDLDCGACDPVCGDRSCNGTETCTSCQSDCGACPAACGDTRCTRPETCTTCAADCGACPTDCGDTTCSATETCSTCPDDCGMCPGECGDATCDEAETCATCPADCGACTGECGDATCDPTETCATCAGDCGACPTDCDSTDPFSCSGNDICVDDACVNAFNRTYTISVEDLVVAELSLDGENWDVGGGAPDPYVVIELSDVEILTTETADDTFEPTFTDSVDVLIPAGSKLSMEVFDEDITFDDPILTCVVDPLTADFIRGSGVRCVGIEAAEGTVLVVDIH